MFEGIIDVRDHRLSAPDFGLPVGPTEQDDAFWAAQVSSAVATGNLGVVYQPVVDLRSARVSHHEALVRLVTPVSAAGRCSDPVGPAAAGRASDAGFLVAARHFMPAAERSGLGPAVDLWVVAHVLDALARARAEGRRLRVAVNLSAATAGDAVHMAAIAGLIRHRGVDPTAVEFEITETVAMDRPAAAADGVARLRAMGCQFAIDDFGTGYSSLARIRDLPVDRIKVDRSFVAAVGADPVADVVVRAAVELASLLGRTTVAEGVEDRATLRALRDLGVDLVQGWLAGRPARSPIGSGLSCG